MLIQSPMTTSHFNAGDFVRVRPNDDTDPTAIDCAGLEGVVHDVRTTPFGNTLAMVKLMGGKKPVAFHFEDLELI